MITIRLSFTAYSVMKIGLQNLVWFTSASYPDPPHGLVMGRALAAWMIVHGLHATVGIENRLLLRGCMQWQCVIVHEAEEEWTLI